MIRLKHETVNTFEAAWSGKFPNHCSGRWTLTMNGQNITCFVPKEMRTEPMGTFGSYLRCGLDENWEEYAVEYEDGMRKEDWIKKNHEWMSHISPRPEDWDSIYEAFNKEDWRYGCCGGCI